MAMAAAGLGCATQRMPPPTALPFIQDDFTSAQAAASARKVPIFVECWAPW
jgi:hypothetical protein